MKQNCDILIIGAGPAGLCAANIFANTDKKVILLERDPFLGGQLVKQTHMFLDPRSSMRE